MYNFKKNFRLATKGGYCIKSLSEGVALTIRGLLGYPCPRLDDFKQPDPVYEIYFEFCLQFLIFFFCNNFKHCRDNSQSEGHLASILVFVAVFERNECKCQH